MPRISIVVLNYNNLKDTIACLESLRGMIYEKDRYEVIVADNGSCEDVYKVLKERYGIYVRLINNKKNYGFAEGNNIALRKIISEGRADYIFLLNNDSVVDKQVLNEAVKPFLLHADVGVVAVKTLDYECPKKINTAGIEVTYDGTPVVRGMFCDAGSPRYNVPRYIFGASGCSAVYRVDALKDVALPGENYFDKDYFCYNEDTDLAWRLQLRGWKCFYQPAAIVYHKHSITAGRYSIFKIYYGQRNRNWTVYKNYPLEYIFISFPYYVIKLLLWYIYGFISPRRIRTKEFGENIGYFKLMLTIIKALISAHKGLQYVFAKRRYIMTYIKTIGNKEAKRIFKDYRAGFKALLQS